MKRLLLVAVLGLVFLAGAVTGYYFGYDIGFERAVRILEQ
jgi:hypothetical protein